MRTRILVSTLFILALTGLVWSQPAERPRVFLGLGGEPADNGIMVRDVTADGPAAKAGIKPGDVITKVGDKQIVSLATVGEALAGKNPGDKLSITALRDGKEVAIEVTLAAPQAGGATQPRPSGAPTPPRGAFLGVMLQELTPELKSRLGVAAEKGALITEVLPNSAAAKADLKEGDVITAVDGAPVESAQALRETIQKSGVGQKLAFKVSRSDKTLDVSATLDAATTDRFAPRVIRPVQPTLPRIVDDATKVRELERRVQELEKRIAELEKKGGKPQE